MSEATNPREIIMAEANASRAALVAEESAVAIPEVAAVTPEAVEFEPDPSLAKKEPAQASSAGASEPGPTTDATAGTEAPIVQQAPAEPEMVEVRIDHETLKVPKADVDADGGVKAYQINRAAEKRLAAANELLARARAAPPAQQAPPPPQVNPDDELRALNNAIRFGSDDDALAAQKRIQELHRQPSANELLQHIIPAVRTQISAETAEKQFVDDYKDILSDPDIVTLAIVRKEQRLKAGERVTDWPAFYRSIGEPLREKFGKPALDLDKRRDAKAQLTNPTVVSVKPPAEPETKIKTGSDIVREMRKARGQPV